jgi:hypothetical protein
MEATITILSALAGGLILFSSMPPLIDQIKKVRSSTQMGELNAQARDWPQVKSRAMQATGNMLWTGIGIAIGNVPMAFTCGVSSVLLLVLTYFLWRN